MDIDINKLQVMTEKLNQADRALEEKYKAMFEHAQDAIFLMKDDQYVDCNAAAIKMFGCSRKQLLKIRPDKLSPEFQPDGTSSAGGVASRTSATIQGKPQRFMWRHLTCKGKPFDVEVRLNEIFIGGEGYFLAVLRKDEGG